MLLSNGMPNDEERKAAVFSRGIPNSDESENDLSESVDKFQNLENGAGSSNNTGICRMHDMGVASSQSMTLSLGSEMPDSMGSYLPRIRAALAAPPNGEAAATGDGTTVANGAPVAPEGPKLRIVELHEVRTIIALLKDL